MLDLESSRVTDNNGTDRFGQTNCGDEPRRDLNLHHFSLEICLRDNLRLNGSHLRYGCASSESETHNP